MQKIKLKGVGRPRKRRGSKNPFDLCLSRRIFRKNKEVNKSAGIGASFALGKEFKEGSKEEAEKIVEVAEQLGLQLAKDKNEVVKVVTDQLLKGNI